MPTYFIKKFIKSKRRDWSNRIVETVAPLASWRLTHWCRHVQKCTFWSFGQNVKRFLVKYFNPKRIKKAKIEFLLDRITHKIVKSAGWSWRKKLKSSCSKVFDAIYKNFMWGTWVFLIYFLFHFWDVIFELD